MLLIKSLKVKASIDPAFAFLQARKDNPDPMRWDIGMARAHRKVTEAIKKAIKAKPNKEAGRTEEPEPTPEIESLSPEESDVQEETTQEDAPVLAEYIDSDNKPVSAEEINEARKAYDEYLSAPLSDEERDAMKKRLFDQIYGNGSKPDAPVIEEATREPSKSSFEGKSWKFDGRTFQNYSLGEHRRGANFFPKGTASVEDGKLMIRFSSFPPEGAKRRIKSAGFTWNPDAKAWTLNDAVASGIKPQEGESIEDGQS